MIVRFRRFLLAVAAAAMPGLAAAQSVDNGTGAELRILDKLNGITQDQRLTNQERVIQGRIEVELQECRYPVGNPAGEAYAFVTVREIGVAEPVFRGWMIASSPAVNPMDHPRYDVWVLRCTTS
ncbi:hypothetical protein FIU97_13795 [Roseivivax sp. THAF40]|uniref:DUF2155 domain-containing protein n=1 Tax=Roseivivax sp. THAF197b TaxID=2588299 RepID=UPI0012AA7C02|nr:DUF2155 domain-containing protein [Roseivivax sp. THAF197b]QFS83816.1 hypothetical protein FIV09_13355 [Roseivivax sp. THAF197b]QFT47648.1 hypothetical protein FIU97_13795 [Roseivivax sp. THAF40]